MHKKTIALWPKAFSLWNAMCIGMVALYVWHMCQLEDLEEDQRRQNELRHQQAFS